MPSPAPPGRGTLRQQLTLADCGHVHADEELVRGDRPLATPPRIVNVASSTTRSGGRWFVGSVTQTFPPIVPRFRTWTSAIVAATSARIGRATSTSDEAMSGV